MSEKTAIVVLYYHKVRLTSLCIQAILEAGYPPQTIYCFDNGSDLEEAQEIQRLFPACQHLRIQENLGFSGGFNRSLAHVFAADYTAALFCTNDTLVQPGAVEACNHTASKTGAGLVAPLVVYLSQSDKIDATGAWFNRETGNLHHYHEYGLPLLLTPARDYIPGTAVWISRAAFRALGGTDEAFFMYWEDVDLCFRAHQLQIPLARCYEARIGHGGGQTCRKKPLYTTFYFQRNRIRFCQRYLTGENKQRVLHTIYDELLQARTNWEKNNDVRRLTYFEQLREEFNFPH